MQIAYSIVGMFTVASFGILFIVLAFHKLCEAIQHLRENRYSEWAKNVCRGIDRWCDYEFPQVGFTARYFSKSVSSGWSFNEDSFREALRRGEWKPKEVKP